MTREKQIKRNDMIACAWLDLLGRGHGFDYWIDMDWAANIISIWCDCPPYIVRRIFWKRLYPLDSFRDWLRDMEY